MQTLTDRLRAWKTDRMAFRREAILLEDGTPFGERMEPWQAEDFAALDSGQFRHAYIERPRGHAKTFDLGTEAVTELMLGPPRQRLFCAAADEDQARLLFEDVAGQFERNPLLRGSVRITQKEIVVPATGSRLRVLNSNAPTVFGLRPDWIAVDELAEHRGRELWDSLWTATGKRPNCRTLVISSAGWDRTSIAWEVRTLAEREADWYFSARGQCASWIAPEWLEQQRRTLPAHVFARLHENRWVEAVGAFFTFHEVTSVFTDRLPLGAGRAAIGVDLGVVHDRSVIALVREVPQRGALPLYVVEQVHSWTPDHGERVDLQAVEDAIERTARQMRATVTIDPWQGVLMAERLRARGMVVEEFQFSAGHRRQLFSTLLDAVRGRRLKARPHEGLRRELLSLEVTDSASGWRVNHRVGGHDDHVVAVALALTALAETPRAVPLIGAHRTAKGLEVVGIERRVRIPKMQLPVPIPLEEVLEMDSEHAIDPKATYTVERPRSLGGGQVDIPGRDLLDRVVSPNQRYLLIHPRAEVLMLDLWSKAIITEWVDLNDVTARLADGWLVIGADGRLAPYGTDFWKPSASQRWAAWRKQQEQATEEVASP